MATHARYVPFSRVAYARLWWPSPNKKPPHQADNWTITNCLALQCRFEIKAADYQLTNVQLLFNVPIKRNEIVLFTICEMLSCQVVCSSGTLHTLLLPYCNFANLFKWIRSVNRMKDILYANVFHVNTKFCSLNFYSVGCSNFLRYFLIQCSIAASVCFTYRSYSSS